MPHLDVSKVLSAEYILGVLIAIAISYAGFASWRSGVEAKMAVLEERAKVAAADHDTVISLQSDVKFIREGVAELRRTLIPKKEASIGQ